MYREPELPSGFFDEEIVYKEPAMLTHIRKYVLGPMVRIIWIPLILISPLVWAIMIIPAITVVSLAGWVLKGKVDEYWYRESKYDDKDPWKVMEPYWALNLLKRLKLD